MRGGVILPERPQIANLPAPDGFGRSFVTGVWCELVGQSPTADAGSVGFKVEPAKQFAGGGAIGGGRLGREELGQQGNDRSRPLRLMITAGNTGGPDVGLALSARSKVLAVKLVKAWTG